MYAQLVRKYHRDATLGELSFYLSVEDVKNGPVATVKTLELPWKDNRQSISCIPEGVYLVKKRWSDRHRDHFHILDVPGREWILIHIANFTRELQGCIAPGMSHADIDQDGIMDVVSSRKAMGVIHRFGGDGFTLKIMS